MFSVAVCSSGNMKSQFVNLSILSILWYKDKTLCFNGKGNEMVYLNKTTVFSIVYSTMNWHLHIKQSSHQG